MQSLKPLNHTVYEQYRSVGWANALKKLKDKLPIYILSPSFNILGTHPEIYYG